MDSYLIELKDALEQSGFNGTQSKFKKSRELIDFCIEEKKVVRVTSPQQLNMEFFFDYHKHLLNLARKFIKNNGIDSWEDLMARQDMSKSSKILHEFGIRAELFDPIEEEVEEAEENKISMTEIFDLAYVHLGFSGSETALKNRIQKDFGSVAEFCLEKGLPINATKWEDEQVAVRVAKKLGSLEVIRSKSKSLIKFLKSNDLLVKLNLPETSFEDLIVLLTHYMWGVSEKSKNVLEKWFIDSNNLSALKENPGDIPNYSTQLLQALSPEELGLLYNDFLVEIEVDGEASDVEKRVTQIVDQDWRSTMVPYAEQALAFKRNPFNPNSVVSAIGYILFQAVSVDGHIHFDEVKELKLGLSQFKNLNSRSVLAAVNFCLHGSHDKSIFGLHDVLKNQKQNKHSILGCCQYLLENTSFELRNGVCNLVEQIAKADGVVHENEKWLLQVLKEELVKEKLLAS